VEHHYGLPVQPSTPLLSVRDLRVTFGPVRALDGVDLSLSAGELVVLTGEPGAGKTTLVRCLAGDVTRSSGEILLDGEPFLSGGVTGPRLGIGVVWQDLELCDNLDVAGNLLLGHETRRLMFSDSRFHARAASLLAELGVPIFNTQQPVRAISSGQRQLLAVAKVIGRGSRVLVLDEPTAPLGATETGHVEDLMAHARDEGRAVLVVSRDIDQMLRIADRIVVLRNGRVVAELDPRSTHPDDVSALLSGQQVDTSARRQLTRLHGLADRLSSADPSSSLSLILSTLGAAIGASKLAIHVVGGRSLVCAASLGLEPAQLSDLERLVIGAAGGPPGRAAELQRIVIEDDLRARADSRAPGVSEAWAEIAASWSVPVMGPDGISAVITVFRTVAGAPAADEVDLLALYAGWAASAVERDRLLAQATARNRVLETIREMLETLAGPGAVHVGLTAALQMLRRGLQAREVGLLIGDDRGVESWRSYDGPLGQDPRSASPELREAADRALAMGPHDGSAHDLALADGRSGLAVPFLAPGAPATLVASWDGQRVTEAERALVEDAAHSLRLALEREKAAVAHQETAALRRSQELQRGFLSRLSHELRTPLTAIRGYASSLSAPDVTWDGESEQRFLDRIAAESARLGRLVDDLLDFSAIESGVLRLQPDWCELELIIEAAVSCLPQEWSSAVTLHCDPDLPPVWADHDRLEQLFVNLVGNAVRHNPPGTRVQVSARVSAGEVEIAVSDDGVGFPRELPVTPSEAARRGRSQSAGAGLGLSIAQGIVDAHGGHLELVRPAVGTTFLVRLPIEGAGRAEVADEAAEASLSALLGDSDV
jgi:signal transduction histidine kinase/ABC-type multidrug transport system ATPase subunit